jgi:hypothetical protein
MIFCHFNNYFHAKLFVNYFLGKLVQQSVVRLFQYLEISDEDRELHRIYDTEIIELGTVIHLIVNISRWTYMLNFCIPCSVSLPSRLLSFACVL